MLSKGIILKCHLLILAFLCYVVSVCLNNGAYDMRPVEVY